MDSVFVAKGFLLIASVFIVSPIVFLTLLKVAVVFNVMRIPDGALINTIFKHKFFRGKH